MLSVFNPVQMSAYVGHIIPKGDPEDFFQLNGTLAINQGGIEMHGTWIANNEAHIFQGLSQPSFRLTHKSSMAYEDKNTMNGWFLFYGSFEYNDSAVMEDGVKVHLSQLDNGILSVSGRGMNEIGVFTFSGEGKKSDADGSVYKVILRKKYIYEAGTKVWKWHSLNEEGRRELCVGEVIKFDVKKSRVGVYFIRDGKSEWISENIAIEIERTAVPPKENKNIQPIEAGARIGKYFLLQNSKKRKYTGRVISCHPKKNLLTIEYDDGTKEELEEDVVRHVQIVDNPERRAAHALAWSSKQSPHVAPFPLEQVVSSTRVTATAPKAIAKTSPEVIDLTTSSDEDEDAFNDAYMGRHNKKLRTVLSQLKVAKSEWDQAKANCELIVAKASSELNVAKAQSTVTMATLELKIALLEKSKQNQEQAMSGDYVTTEPIIAKVEELTGRKAPPTSLSHAPKENINGIISPLL